MFFGRLTHETMVNWERIEAETEEKAPIFIPLNKVVKRSPPLYRYFPREGQAEQFIGSCVGHAAANALAIQHRTKGKVSFDVEKPLPPPSNAAFFSPLWFYHHARKVSERKRVRLLGQGALVSDCLEAVKEFGAIAEKFWPSTCLNEARYKNALPSQLAETVGSPVVGKYVRLRSVKECLDYQALGYSVVFACPWKGTYANTESGYMEWESNPPYIAGGHAFVLAGYDSDTTRPYQSIVNSWGSKWADNGVGFVDFLEFWKDMRDEKWAMGMVEAYVITGSVEAIKPLYPAWRDSL
jgi:hypothetical protein